MRNIINESYTSVTLAAISDSSVVYKGLNVIEGADVLGVNETYVWIGSKSANNVKLKDMIKLNLTYYLYQGPRGSEEKTIGVLSLKVVGFVELEEKAYSIATGEWDTPIIMMLRDRQALNTLHEDLLIIVSWEETFAKLLDSIPRDVPYYKFPFSTQILAYIDRDRLINPWDVPRSMDAVNKISGQVNNVVSHYGMSASNNLGSILMMYYITSIFMRFAFIIVALPVFFVAWYVGTTVSDVSYNLRRREIGLLLTKGFSNSQLFKLFLIESILIGIIGGLVGLGLGFMLGPFFTVSIEGLQGVTPVLGAEVIIITLVFSLAITLLSTYRPSRRAAKLPAVEALREYTYMEEVKPYRQRWPWIAFILGLYKLVIFLLGINLTQIFARPPPFTNIFLIILLGIWLLIDGVLTYIGPLLFFWGFTKIFIRGSLKFQELVARAAKFLGDLGTLATKNVQRNPARAASIAFLVALIVGYSFQTIGAVAYNQDYTTRQIKAEVSADINVSLSPTANITKVLNIIENMPEIVAATVQYSTSGSFPGDTVSSRQIIAVNPDNWLSTAYYEDDWFNGNTAEKAFQLMRTKNQTIILEQSVAASLDKKLGDPITVTIGSTMLQLEIVGFFGREVPQEYSWQTFRSYIPIALYQKLNLGWLSSTTILVKIERGADGKAVASEIREIDGVSYVSSVAEEMDELRSNLRWVGPLNIQRLGVVFAILAASVAVGLATFVSLQERKKEVSIMWARGLSFKQLVIMLFTENMAVVTFAVVLGTVVGLIVVHGNVAASNAELTYTLVRYRMVFPIDAVFLLASCLFLIFASTIIPTLLLTKRYISKVERVVRL